MKINRLTAEQTARFAEWRDRWTGIGLATGPADRIGAREGVIAAYAAAGLSAPVTFIWLRSPLEGAVGSVMLEALYRDKGVRASVWDSVGDSVGASVGDSVRASVGDSVGASVGASVWDSVWASVWDSVGASVGDSVRASVWASVGASVWDSVWASVRASVRASVGASVWADVCWGQHDAGWLSFHDYFRVVVGIESCARLSGLIRIAECCSWWWPRSGAVILTERPTRLQRDARGQLHAEDGMAIEYPDGWGVYALHGVRVPRELVMTPAGDLDPRSILSERNAEIRREIVRKVGIERVCAALGATVEDRRGEVYELLSLDLGDGRRRPYLKMRNPSIGVFHIEGVHPNCKTVEEALKWRNGTDATPVVLT